MIILVNGFPQTPSSLIVPNGSVGFTLNVDATVIAAPGGFVSGSVEVVFQFNSIGQIQPNAPAVAAQIYSNLELNPQNSIGLGTYYLVTFYDQNGAKLNKVPMWWQFPEVAGSTVDISKVTPISTIGGNVIFYPTNFAGGGGTVLSVGFVGDGTVLSATPSTPVTTTGNVTAALLTQSSNLVFAGPATGPAAAPTFRSLTSADLPATTSIWNQIANPVGNFTLAMTTFASTFTSTIGSLWTWQNLTAATNIADAPSPALTLIGQFWNAAGPASVTKTFTIQEAGGFLKFSQAGSLNQVYPYQFDSNIQTVGNILSNFAAFSFQTGSANLVYTITSVNNTSGGLTTYNATVPGGTAPQKGQNITVAGFVLHAGNNGYFPIHDSTASTITVYSSAGIAETHAATGTLDGYYAGIGGFSVQVASSTVAVFPIFGASHPSPLQLNTYPNDPGWVLTLKGDVTDAAYGRVVNDGATGNHGFELGGIIDGTGVAPVTLQLGHFNGISSAVLNAPLTIPDTATAGGIVTHATRVVTISAAHLNNLHVTPIQVLPAPGANLTYVVNNALAHYRFNTTGFTLNAASQLTLGFTTTPLTYSVWLLAALVGFCDTTPTTDIYTQEGSLFNNIVPVGQVNQPLYVTNDTANMSGGDGTVTLTIDYSIVNVSQTGTAV